MKRFAMLTALLMAMTLSFGCNQGATTTSEPEATPPAQETDAPMDSEATPETPEATAELG